MPGVRLGEKNGSIEFWTLDDAERVEIGQHIVNNRKKVAISLAS